MASDPVQDLVLGMGAMAEMAHHFHDRMVKSGASEKVATAAMNGFIAAFWHEAMEDNRKKKQLMEEQDDGEG